MTHFTRIRTKLRDAGTLAEALRAIGLAKVEVHDQAHTLFGYQGDARPERAEVIVRREHIGQWSNDIGFARQSDGSFEAIISDYDRGTYDQAWLTRLTQAYGHAATLRYAANNGYEVATDELQSDGTRLLPLRRTT